MKKADLGNDPGREALLTRKAALMAAAGKTDTDISKTLGITKGALEVWRHSPLWTTLVERYEEEIEDRGIQSIADDLAKDAPDNVRFIKRVRDGQFEDSKDRMQLRLSAAKMLLDKQAPNADARANDEKAARIILDGKLLGHVLNALRDVGTIDVTTEAIEEMQGTDKIPELIEASTPEEFTQKYIREIDDEDR